MEGHTFITMVIIPVYALLSNLLVGRFPTDAGFYLDLGSPSCKHQLQKWVGNWAAARISPHHIKHHQLHAQQQQQEQQQREQQKQ